MTAQSNRWKKRLGSYLRDLRAQAGKSAAEAAESCGMSESSISLYEGGQARPKLPVMLKLLTLYTATATQRDNARALWEDAGTRTIQVRMPADAPKDLRKLVRAEQDAVGMRVLSHSMIPGLLQTEAYMRTLNRGAPRFLDLASMDSYIKARVNRQKLLSGPTPLRLHALIDEAAIHRLVGGTQVMCHQLGHLLSVGAQANVTIQVIPFEAGSYGAISGPCAILDFPEPTEAPGVYLEYLGGGDWVENVLGIQRITTAFEDVRTTAMTPSDSADLIRRQQRALEIDDSDYGMAQEQSQRAEQRVC